MSFPGVLGWQRELDKIDIGALKFYDACPFYNGMNVATLSSLKPGARLLVSLNMGNRTEERIVVLTSAPSVTRGTLAGVKLRVIEERPAGLAGTIDGRRVLRVL